MTYAALIDEALELHRAGRHGDAEQAIYTAAEAIADSGATDPRLDEAARLILG